MSRSRWAFAMVVLSLATACSGDPTGSAPTGVASRAGTLMVRLNTPHADDGALTFKVSGPAIDSVVAVDASLRVFTRNEGGSTVVGVVVGALANGAVLTLQVPDVGAAAGYTANLLEVADRQDVLRTSLAGYALTVIP